MKVPFVSKIEEHYITVDGIRTRYITAGKGEPVLLVHGIGGFAEVWQSVIDTLSPGYKVIALDMVGFGRSDKPTDRLYTYQTFARFVLSFLDVLQLTNVTLIGHSLGGGITLQTSIYAPERIKKLIIISSGGLGREFTIFLRLMTLPFIGELMTKPSMKSAQRSLKGGVYDPSIIRGEWVECVYEMSSLPGSSETFLKTLRDSANLSGGLPWVIDPIVNNLGRITAPTLVIWGEDDRVVPYKHSAVALRRISNTRFLALKQCGHNPVLEHSGKVLNEIAIFMG